MLLNKTLFFPLCVCVVCTCVYSNRKWRSIWLISFRTSTLQRSSLYSKPTIMMYLICTTYLRTHNLYTWWCACVPLLFSFLFTKSTGYTMYLYSGIQIPQSLKSPTNYMHESCQWVWWTQSGHHCRDPHSLGLPTRHYNHIHWTHSSEGKRRQGKKDQRPHSNSVPTLYRWVSAKRVMESGRVPLFPITLMYQSWIWL